MINVYLEVIGLTFIEHLLYARHWSRHRRECWQNTCPRGAFRHVIEAPGRKVEDKETPNVLGKVAREGLSEQVTFDVTYDGCRMILESTSRIGGREKLSREFHL